ncbi:hypothetical protein BH24ACT15_BH24ACT15_29710 [soil metagenome]
MTASDRAPTVPGGGLARFAERASTQMRDGVDRDVAADSLPAPLQRFLAPRVPRVGGQTC